MTSSPHPPTTTDRIRQQLEAEIGSGAWLPGQPLDEQALSERFQVSRTPVREALLQLSVLGFVEVVPRGGIFVRALTHEEANAMFEALACLEGLCAALAAERMSPAQHRQLARVQRQAARRLDADGAATYENTNQAFHNVIYASAGNPYLAGQIQHIRKRTYSYRRLQFGHTGRARQSHAEHQTILEALLSGDADAASVAAIEHIAHGRLDYGEFVAHCAGSMFAYERQLREPRRHEHDAILARRGTEPWMFPGLSTH